MHNSNSFDANAAFGGGFMPAQATQATEHSSSPSKNRDSQVLLPVTVKQISNALQSSDDKTNFLIDGVDVNNVTLVGIVFNIVERNADFTFKLDDGTGRIECQRWTHELVDSKEMERIVDGMYVRVHGHLKGFHGKKLLMVFSVRPLTEFDEITYHYVDCISVHTYNTRVQGSAPPLGMPNSSVNTPSKGYQAAPSNQSTEGVQFNVVGLKDIEERVIYHLKQHDSVERGIHVHDIAKSLGVPVDRIRSAIKYLEEEGNVYSTIDGDHYKYVENV